MPKGCIRWWVYLVRAFVGGWWCYPGFFFARTKYTAAGAFGAVGAGWRVFAVLGAAEDRACRERHTLKDSVPARIPVIYTGAGIIPILQGRWNKRPVSHQCTRQPSVSELSCVIWPVARHRVWRCPRRMYTASPRALFATLVNDHDACGARSACPPACCAVLCSVCTCCAVLCCAWCARPVR